MSTRAMPIGHGHDAREGIDEDRVRPLEFRLADG
jgi:hypothetical protein